MTVIWLFRWLLFRLLFSSGVVKLLSGDASWRDLTALKYHFETQPLPTWIGWWFYQMPPPALKMLTLFVLLTELVVPFLIFTPRRPRLVGFILLLLMQMLIMLTGNYSFFCWLVIALCILLLDDSMLRRCWPARWRRRVEPAPVKAVRPWFQSAIIALAVVVILPVSLLNMIVLFSGFNRLPEPCKRALYLAQPSRTINSYGLFAWMTKERPEIIIEGSSDGWLWKAYEFKWKPGDVHRCPQFVEPHQPRLDWQMWFAALDHYQDNPWLILFMVQLLKGAPDVLGLLKSNPFPARPPQAIRAVVYRYHFTGWQSHAKGQWWQRQEIGLYAPRIMLKEQNPFQETRLGVNHEELLLIQQKYYNKLKIKIKGEGIELCADGLH
jgi:hypothetical protein